MMTVTGEYVTREQGAPSVEAMALGLSRIPRFAGQTLFDWNVADHLVVCMRWCRILRRDGGADIIARYGVPLELHVLLHDAHEAMTGDIPTTFKTDDMRRLQRQLDERLYAALQLPMPTSSEREWIKAIDAGMLLAEAKVVTPPATYEKIVLERGGALAFPMAIDVVQQYLHDDLDSREAFLDAMSSLRLWWSEASLDAMTLRPA